MSSAPLVPLRLEHNAAHPSRDDRCLARAAAQRCCLDERMVALGQLHAAAQQQSALGVT
jgi:hypothetical protein